MAKRNSSNQDYTNNADGWDLTGGTTPRKLTVSGGDVSIAGSGSAVITFPASTATLATLALTETLSNKSFSTALLPSITDGAAIGSTTFQWSDLFLAEGSVINWDNGDVTLTQTNNVLAVGGGGTLTFGGADGSAIVDVRIASGALQGLRVEGAATSDISFSTYVTADGFIRFTFAPDGTMKWGPGSAATDTFLARTATGIMTLYSTQTGATGPILEIYQDSSSPAASDVPGAINFYGRDSAANKQQYAGILATITDATSTSEDSTLSFQTALAGTLASRITLTSIALLPTTNDTISLGNTVAQYTDLFLSEGGVINFDNGDVTITQTGDVLAVSGGDLRVATAGVGTNADSVPTISSTNTLTNKRVNPRTASSTTSSTLTPDISSANVYFRTTQTETLTIAAPTGTPVIGETLAIYVDSAGAQTLTINSTYKVFGAAFPSTTTAGKTFMMTAQYNGTDWKTLWSNAV